MGFEVIINNDAVTVYGNRPPGDARCWARQGQTGGALAFPSPGTRLPTWEVAQHRAPCEPGRRANAPSVLPGVSPAVSVTEHLSTCEGASCSFVSVPMFPRRRRP